MEEKKECSCHHKTKERSDKEYKDLINRLSRIEGQVRGIKKMLRIMYQQIFVPRKTSCKLIRFRDLSVAEW